MIKGNTHINKAFYFLITSLILIGPALFNRYPLLFPDSANYIDVSGSLIADFSRPIGYSLFMRVVSWRATLWTVILFQSLVLNMVLYFSLKRVIKEKLLTTIHFGLLIVLSLMTNAGWISSAILADVFTPIFILFSFIWFSHKKASVAEKVLYLVALGWLLSMHLSHIPIASLLMISLLLLSWFRKSTEFPFKAILNRSYIYAASIILAFLFISMNNYWASKEFQLSRGNYLFAAGRLAESGILQDWLTNNCDENTYPLCNHIEDIPESAPTLIWNEAVLLNKMDLSWEQADSAFKPIIQQIYRTPEYYPSMLWAGITKTVIQLMQVKIGAGFSPYKKGSGNYYQIEYRLPHELKQMKKSKQYNGLLKFDILNAINILLLGASVFVLFLWYPGMNGTERLFLFFIVFGILFNAFITAGLANVSTHLQNRVAWLTLVLAFSYICKFLNRSTDGI